MSFFDNDTYSENELLRNRQIDEICMEFEQAWKAGQLLDLQAYVGRLEGEELQRRIFLELLLTEIDLRSAKGELFSIDQYLDKYQTYAIQINKAFQIRKFNTDIKDDSPSVQELEKSFEEISRFRVIRRLGRGSFGVVYLAEDRELGHNVALKFAISKRSSDRSELSQIFQEAVTIKIFDHPNIIKLYDVGSHRNWVYLVNQYIDGCNLKEYLQQHPDTTHRECATMIASIAKAIGHAHAKDFFHRDLKPANILLDQDFVPYVADFGLAVHENQQEWLKGERTGTPRYMSPELVRGESHRLDGRSDIWSLGVLLYQMLVGRCPFNAKDVDELYDEIAHRDPRPPRQSNPKIPIELERICLKCLSKRARDRYFSAYDLERDLTDWLESENAISASFHQNPQPQKIIPRGLRSFNSQDADFYLDLLPGPVDKMGVPESVSFWRHRIVGSKEEPPFDVGLIYGPSGAGKSSFVLAGLLPLLGNDIEVAYVQASASRTEIQLKHLFRKKVDELPNVSLAESIRLIREKKALFKKNKLLIVIDQFEQWLAANPDITRSDLVAALRQCDGQRTQCLLLIRDDFWLATSRLLSSIEVLIEEGKNASLFDLFSLEHAEYVLVKYGAAFGRLPEDPEGLSRSQLQFVQAAVGSMASEGKVVCARLVLFAEIFKAKDWELSALNKIGGADGVGLAFLTEAFCGENSPSRFRSHEKSARGLLSQLLPNENKGIRGGAANVTTLLEATEYQRDHQRFNDLIRLLDHELRLITPTNSDIINSGNETSAPNENEPKYELTHDFLIRPISRWVAEEQLKTRRGQLKARLTQCSAAWHSQPKNQYLPSLFDSVRFGITFRRKELSHDEALMMKSAIKLHCTRCLCWVVALLLGIFISARVYDHFKSQSLVSRLLSTSTKNAMEILAEVSEHQNATKPLLVSELKKASSMNDEERQLILGLALMHSNEISDQRVVDWILDGSAVEIGLIANRLKQYPRSKIQSALESTLQSQESTAKQRVNAACTLAIIDSRSTNWQLYSETLIHDIVSYDSLEIGQITEHLRQIWNKILLQLAIEIENGNKSELPVVLNIARRIEHEDARLSTILKSRFTSLLSDLDKREDFAQTSEALVNVSSGLAALGSFDSLLQLLARRDFVAPRSKLIDNSLKYNLDIEVLFRRLAVEREAFAKAGILLSIGRKVQRGENFSSQKTRQLLRILENDTDQYVRAAALWLLNRLRHKDSIDVESARLIGNKNWQTTMNGSVLVKIDAPGLTTISRDGRPYETAQTPYSQNPKRILLERDFWISSTEITVDQFREFAPAHNSSYQSETNGNQAVTNVTWFQAAEYCNWLSQVEGISKEHWCYLPNDEGRYAEGMQIAKNYQNLKGYRLPNEAEWNYATAASSPATWCCGDDPRLLDQYAWHRSNSLGIDDVQIVGLLMPNKFGLFDMHGNVEEWCQDTYTFTDSELVSAKLRRLKKGGMIDLHPEDLTCAIGVGALPDSSSGRTGFRIVRAVVPSDPSEN